MKAGHTQKLYLARVAGDFGSILDPRWRRNTTMDEGTVGWAYEELSGEDSLGSDGAGRGGGGGGGGGEGAESGGGDSGVGPWIRVQQPIRCVSHKDGVYECAVRDPSTTVFVPKTEAEMRERGR